MIIKIRIVKKKIKEEKTKIKHQNGEVEKNCESSTFDSKKNFIIEKKKK